MMKAGKPIFATLVLLMLSISCKKECHETWHISGRLLNGTSLKPMPGVPLNYGLSSYTGKHGYTYSTYLGYSFTDDSGYFNFEYNCNNDHSWDHVTIYSPSDYKDTFSALADFSKDLFQTIYWSDTGTIQINLEQESQYKPLYGDTLFIAHEAGAPNGGHNLIYRDTFTKGTVPQVWKTIKGSTGKGSKVYWGRGASVFLNALKGLGPAQNRSPIWVSPDPNITIYTVKY